MVSTKNKENYVTLERSFVGATAKSFKYEKLLPPETFSEHTILKSN